MRIKLWARVRLTMRAAAVAAPLLATSGCTTYLTTAPDAPGASAPTNGIPYRLPATQVDVVVTWTLKGCKPGAKPGDDGTVEYAPSAVFTAKTVEGESQIIDYSHLVNSFKTGEIKVEYQEKTLLLKTINATIEGHEAEATGEAIKLGLTVARLAMGLPAPSSGGAVGVTEGLPAPPVTPCTETTYTEVQTLEEKAKRIKAIPAEAKLAADRMAVLKARVLGGKLTDADKTELNALQTKADDLDSELATLNDIKKQLLSKLSFSETLTLPPTKEVQAGKLAVSDEKLAKWFVALLKPAAAKAASAQVTAARKANTDAFTVTAHVTALAGEAACRDDSCGALSVPVNGVVFRQPIQGQLIVVTQAQGEPLVDDLVSVAQLGRLRVLPLKSAWGEKNTLSATFAADGLPTTIEYKALTAKGVAALKAGNDAGSGLLSLITQIDAKKTADAAAAKAAADQEGKDALAGVNGQIALLEAQTKLNKLQQPADLDLETLQAQLAILRLKKEQSDLETAIAKNGS